MCELEHYHPTLICVRQSVAVQVSDFQRHAALSGHKLENSLDCAIADGTVFLLVDKYLNLIKNSSAVVVNKYNESTPDSSALASIRFASSFPKPLLRTSDRTANERNNP